MVHLTEEQLDDLKSFARSDVFRTVLSLINDTVETIKGNVLSVPLDKDPEKAALALLQERMKLEGAVALRNAFAKKVEDLRSAK